MFECFFHGNVCFLVMSRSRSSQIRCLVVRGAMMSSINPKNNHKHSYHALPTQHNTFVVRRHAFTSSKHLSLRPLWGGGGKKKGGGGSGKIYLYTNLWQLPGKVCRECLHTQSVAVVTGQVAHGDVEWLLHPVPSQCPVTYT